MTTILLYAIGILLLAFAWYHHIVIQTVKSDLAKAKVDIAKLQADIALNVSQLQANVAAQAKVL